MTANKEKKNVKQRGGHTHGWGHKKKHRGAGSRGGRGMAGSGKRADQNKMRVLKQFGTKYFGKHGFKSKKQFTLKSINLYEIEKLGKDIVELKGYKVLGTGNLTKKIKITANKFSKKALEKIKKTGGEAVTYGEDNVGDN
ncbi:MAG: uL15 family ribosomal protein [Nanoarchaeota archaeon]|nr:uL15 family ribosomal protein [Nanoarchaeota archaeon]MBU1445031.1 uL15 family ribosomal protein [Nanoarchaeota archaeon]MBU2406871.1 uL15 family ribosomal protein [Nanoarchaeota archaeon]MBU2420041.1 uL15 family ribosomal protein [Nanoarchaeota archaeon]MBU2475479.1 uL15 family ribosomal protein [Nanoarchaeota archaeon]